MGLHKNTRAYRYNISDSSGRLSAVRFSAAQTAVVRHPRFFVIVAGVITLALIGTGYAAHSSRELSKSVNSSAVGSLDAPVEASALSGDTSNAVGTINISSPSVSTSSDVSINSTTENGQTTSSVIVDGVGIAVPDTNGTTSQTIENGTNRTEVTITAQNSSYGEEATSSRTSNTLNISTSSPDGNRTTRSHTLNSTFTY